MLPQGVCVASSGLLPYGSEDLVRMKRGDGEVLAEVVAVHHVLHSILEHLEELLGGESGILQPPLGDRPEVEADVVPDVHAAHRVETFDEADASEASCPERLFEELSPEPCRGRRPERGDVETPLARFLWEHVHDRSVERVGEFAHDLAILRTHARICERERAEVAVRGTEVHGEHSTRHEHLSERSDRSRDLALRFALVEQVDHLDAEDHFRIVRIHEPRLARRCADGLHSGVAEESGLTDTKHGIGGVHREDPARIGAFEDLHGGHADAAADVDHCATEEWTTPGEGLVDDETCHRRVVVRVLPVEEAAHEVALCLEV